MKKGVVLAVDNRYVTLMTPEGEFIKMKRKRRGSYKVGEEIELVTSRESYRGTSFLGIAPKKVYIAGAAAALLFGITYLPFFNNNNVSAYMTIDVNPSIEIGLNDDLEVIKLNGLNKEGKRILRGIDDWKQQNVNDIAKKILLETESRGFLKKEKEVVFSTVLLDQDNIELSGDLKKEMELLASNTKKVAEVTVHEGSSTDRKKALEAGLSTGRYIDTNETKDKNKNSNEDGSNKTEIKNNAKTIPTEEKAADNKKVIPSNPETIKKVIISKPVEPIGKTVKKETEVHHSSKNSANKPAVIKENHDDKNNRRTVTTKESQRKLVKPSRPSYPTKPSYDSEDKYRDRDSDHNDDKDRDDDKDKERSKKHDNRRDEIKSENSSEKRNKKEENSVDKSNNKSDHGSHTDEKDIDDD
ncbi:hypothetical protein D0469_03315 [Peribacillus saganii]|uniref:RsgI N-terminal anti-sigma domain-containing protein n=1 Tax=Peribacillus saganii TaxID=2303992 RepID=A0A372LSG2_9BACI|nr:anti-sigma factor domain-containing protein [Peribacillus saganii]RFU70986.1 hypothetical protein D0469_03315 [Peribacillus saganii]